MPAEHKEAAFQEGCLGLILAADRFKPEIGKFSTFAFFYVRQKLIRFIRANCKFETAPIEGASGRFTLQSLHQPISPDEDGGFTLADTIVDSRKNPDEIVCAKDMCRVVRGLLQQITKDLPSEYINALVYRRLLSQSPTQLKDLGCELNVPVAKLKDLEQKIMRRLRREMLKLEVASL